MVPVNITVISQKKKKWFKSWDGDKFILLYYMCCRFYFMFVPIHWSMMGNSRGSDKRQSCWY